MNSEVQQRTKGIDEVDVIEEELLPPVNEFKRFIRVFFARKIVIFGFERQGRDRKRVSVYAE